MDKESLAARLLEDRRNYAEEVKRISSEAALNRELANKAVALSHDFQRLINHLRKDENGKAFIAKYSDNVEDANIYAVHAAERNLATFIKDCERVDSILSKGL